MELFCAISSEGKIQISAAKKVAYLSKCVFNVWWFDLCLGSYDFEYLTLKESCLANLIKYDGSRNPG